MCWVKSFGGRSTLLFTVRDDGETAYLVLEIFEVVVAAEDRPANCG